MTPMEITLLCIGVIIFAASFFIKDRSPAKSEKDIEDEQEQIRALMERELDSMKTRVNDVTDETVEYAMEKAERSLEKISNEKIMAVNDYSNMIMDEIDKNHKEVMFLYDMLNDKQVDVKNSVRKAEAAVKEVEDLSVQAQESSEEFKRNLDDYSNQKIEEVRQASEPEYTPYIPPRVEKPMTAIDMLKARQSEVEPVFNTLNADSFKSVDPNEITLTDPEDVFRPVSAAAASPMEEQSGFIDTIKDDVPKEPKKQSSFMKGFGGNKGNNNQKIIELHEQGLSTVDIAKELNLGVGEVKLVIDLFK